MNDCRGDRDEGFEALVGFARTHRNPSVFLQFTKIVFDQVSPFVGLLVELCREFPVGFRRYNRDDVAIQQVVSQPICIKGPVRQKLPGRQVADQSVGFAQVMSLPGHQTEINKVAECIRQGQYLCRYTPTRAPNGLAQSPPFAPWAER